MLILHYSREIPRFLKNIVHFSEFLRFLESFLEFSGILGNLCLFYFISSCAREFPGFLGNFANAHFDFLFPRNSRDFSGKFVQIKVKECKLFPENFSGIVLGKTRKFYGFTGISLNNFARVKVQDLTKYRGVCDAVISLQPLIS